MAAAVDTGHHHDRRTGERRRLSSYSAVLRGADGMRVSWGGIWGGVLTAVGVLLLLAALGVAVGITAANPGETDPSTLGTGAGIWAGVSLLVALFVGGMVATRIGAIFDRTTSLFEGVLVWVVSILLIGYLASSGIGMLAGGAFNLVSGVGSAVGQMVQGGVDMGSGTVDEMVQRMRSQQTARVIASATGLPQQEVQMTLAQAADRIGQLRDNPAQAAAEARQVVTQLYEKARTSGALEQQAEQVQPAVSRAAWITLGALVVSLLAAVIGAAAGRREPGARLA